MKKIICVFFIVCGFMANAQEPVPDSLVGIYPGVTYIRNSTETEWTEYIDTIYVISIDTSTCLFSCFTRVQTFNNRPLETDYSYCQHSSTNYYTLFYSLDSIKRINNEVPSPPPYTYTSDIRFFGKRIPNSSYVGVKQLSSLKTRAHIYPNPTNENLFVELVNSKKEKFKLVVRNVYGIIVFEDLMTNDNYSINVSNFAKGVYFLEWNNGSEKGIEKFVVY